MRESIRKQIENRSLKKMCVLKRGPKFLVIDTPHQRILELVFMI